MRYRFLIAALLPALAAAQSTASVSGFVFDPSQSPVHGAVIRLTNAVTRFDAAVPTQPDGYFRLANLPFQNYLLTVSHSGFVTHTRALSVRSNVPVSLEVYLELGGTRQSVTVSTADRNLLVDPQQTGSYAQMNQADIDRLPLQASNRGIESALVSFPGFAQNANGAIHPRGAHNQMTFVIDGMPISDQLTGAFANSVDSNIVQTVELFTGNIPAEYGNKVAAVANITTKSGLGSGRKAAGSITASGGGFDTASAVTQVAGETGKLGYSASVTTMKTHRYLDQVSLDNLHNGGHSERAFTRFDYQPSSRDFLRFNAMAGSSSFQLANLRSQQAAGMDQRQLLRDQSALLGWIRTFGAHTTLDSTASLRTTSAQLLPSPGDIPVTASQSRRQANWTFLTRFNHIRNQHNLRAGADYYHFPVKENFLFGVTDPSFDDPVLLPFDLTKQGSLFQFDRRVTGSMASGFVQDNVRWGRFQFALGLRYDRYRLLTQASQFQPRLGMSFHIKETGTVLRLSYNRTFQPPPTENLLLSNSPQSAALASSYTHETIGSGLALIRPERQNFYEAGIQQSLGGRLSLQASVYHKDGWDQQDNNNFFDTGVIFPTSLARIRVNAAEGRLILPNWRGLSATVSATHYRATSTPPFTGGLFIGNSAIEALSMGPFAIDHDQSLALHSILSYNHRSGFFTTWSIRHDSGLVTNPSDPQEVAADPDFADLLPYVNLDGNPPRTRPRTITGFTAGYAHSSEDRTRWELSVQASNLFNTTALYNFQSLFVGTRVVQPRTVGARLRWYF